MQPDSWAERLVTWIHNTVLTIAIIASLVLWWWCRSDAPARLSILLENSQKKLEETVTDPQPASRMTYSAYDQWGLRLARK